MREKLETLSLVQLRAIAKDQGIKYIMKYRKTELIEQILLVTSNMEEKKEEKSVGDEGVEEEVTPVKDAPKKRGRKPKVIVENNENTESVPHSRNNSESINPTRNIRTIKKESAVEKAEDKNTMQYASKAEEIEEYDSNVMYANGILEAMVDGFGFIRCDNFLPGDDDVYVSPSQIRRFKLKTGDFISGKMRPRSSSEKFGALIHLDYVNGVPAEEIIGRPSFEDLTPIFPNKRLRMETSSENKAMRMVDLISPIGKGQRGMIVSQPKAGKTTLIKEIAGSILVNNPDMHMIILLIDERPEEVTDIKEAIRGKNVEVIYSTFDELPEHHKRVSEMVIERAKRLVEMKKDVIIPLDSITRLARAYNMIIPPSGRTLSGGLDPAALHMPKRFFGAARNIREGGSLTILATALVETGSKMDDVVFEEFKGTGNMELVLDRSLSEKRIFPAIDIVRSSTRREDLLLSKEEQEAVYYIRRATSGLKSEDAVDQILDLFSKTHNNREFIAKIKKYLHKNY